VSSLVRSLCAVTASLGVACGLDGYGTSAGAADATDGNQGSPLTTSAIAPDGSGVGNAAVAPGDASASGNTESGGADAGGNAIGAVGVVSADGGTGAANSDGGGASIDASGTCGAGGSGCPQGQQCDATLGCVSCTMDSQCPASARFCAMGNCVQCKSNSHCGGGSTPSCWPGDHKCHAACTSNQQCAQGGNTPTCDMSTGACVGCVSASDCPASQSVCHPAMQQCVQCASSSDCTGTSTPYCSPNGDTAWQCVQCLDNTHCPSSAPNCNANTCGQPGG
jgi:hypothetical protein